MGGCGRLVVDTQHFQPRDLACVLGSLSLHISWMYRELQKGKLPYVRIGGGIRIRMQDIEEYICRRLVGSRECQGGGS